MLLLSCNIFSQKPDQRTYCNPIDLDYRYNFEQLNENISYRSGADPVIVNHRGEYYLFVTISGGWWHSSDLLHWDYVIPTNGPWRTCVPLPHFREGYTLSFPEHLRFKTDFHYHNALERPPQIL